MVAGAAASAYCVAGKIPGEASALVEPFRNAAACLLVYGFDVPRCLIRSTCPVKETPQGLPQPRQQPGARTAERSRDRARCRQSGYYFSILTSTYRGGLTVSFTCSFAVRHREPAAHVPAHSPTKEPPVRGGAAQLPAWRGRGGALRRGDVGGGGGRGGRGAARGVHRLVPQRAGRARGRGRVPPRGALQRRAGPAELQDDSGPAVRGAGRLRHRCEPALAAVEPALPDSGAPELGCGGDDCVARRLASGPGTRLSSLAALSSIRIEKLTPDPVPVQHRIGKGDGCRSTRGQWLSRAVSHGAAEAVLPSVSGS